MSFLEQAAAAAPTRDARFVFTALRFGHADAPVLIVRHAGEGNGEYDSAFITAAIEIGLRLAGRASVGKRNEGRNVDAKLFAKHVVTGWENVCEIPGEPTPFTPEKCEELLLAVVAKRPDWFARLALFVRDADNFRDQPLPSGADLGKG